MPNVYDESLFFVSKCGTLQSPETFSCLLDEILNVLMLKLDGILVRSHCAFLHASRSIFGPFSRAIALSSKQDDVCTNDAKKLERRKYQAVPRGYRTLSVRFFGIAIYKLFLSHSIPKKYLPVGLTRILELIKCNGVLY